MMKTARRFWGILIFILIIIECDSALWGADWRYRYETGAFVCWSNVDIASQKYEFDSLFEIQRELTTRLQIPTIKESIDVYIYENESQWKEFLQAKFPGKPFRVAFFINTQTVFQGKQSRYRIYVYLSEKFGNDLRHEGTHAILHASLQRSVPIWLDEGLAEYYEVPTDRRNNPFWLPLLQQRISNHEFKELKKLEKVNGPSAMIDEYYGDSWAWVCFLLNGPRSVQAILPEYIQDFSSRKLFLTPISQRLSKIDASQKHCVDFILEPVHNP